MFTLSGIQEVFRRYINVLTTFDIIKFSGQHTLRAHLYKLLNKYNIDAVIDVGANEGQFGSHLRNLGYNGEIYSFEPVKSAYEKLSHISRNDNKWFVYNFALGSQPGETVINVSKFSSLSSILNPTTYWEKNWSSIQSIHKQTIQVKTIDQCFLDSILKKGKNYLLKMDTQGYDQEVFKGAKGSISEVRALISELSLIPFYDGMPHYLDSLSAYESDGFAVTGFYPITRNKNLSLNEVDCLMVKI